MTDGFFSRQFKGMALAAVFCLSLLFVLVSSSFSSSQSSLPIQDDNAWVSAAVPDEDVVPHHVEFLPPPEEAAADTEEASPELESEGELLSEALFVFPIEDPLRFLNIYCLGLPIDRNESLLRPPRA